MKHSSRVLLGSFFLSACAPSQPMADDESVGDESTSTEVTDSLDNLHVLEVEGVPDDLASIAAGAIEAFAGSQLCPHANGTPGGGSSGITPSIELDCNEGPDRRCVPVIAGGGPGDYDAQLWADNPVWAGLGFDRTQPHCFHYEFIGINDMQDPGACSFTAQAFADLDADSIFSTYELRGQVDAEGSMVEALFVNLPYE